MGKPEANKLVKIFGTHSGSVITADDTVEKNNETRVREADELGLVQAYRAFGRTFIQIL